MKFTDEIIEQVWQKAQTVDGRDPKEWRKGFVGTWIKRDSYGKADDYGLEIAHMKQVAKGGADKLDNLWAIHWKNKIAKGDDYPTFKTTVTAQDDKNVEAEIFWTM